MRLDELKKVADEFGLIMQSVIKIRLRYLQLLLVDWISYIDEETNSIPALTFTKIIDEMIIFRNYTEMTKKSISIESITNDMIQQAREYPIEKMIEFVNGRAIAFCHTDKTPSLVLDRKRNRAHCFPCGKDFNAVDVKIERDGYKFIDAVKYLSGVA